ncbi:MAG: hypothetical protein HZB76_01325 [Chlamydiae bacterium]|nr:hypothetical protein [Chlamydiota bacterium]
MDQGPINQVPPSPPSGPIQGPQGPDQGGQAPPPAPGPRTFMGMSFTEQQWQMFMNQISKMFVDQIKHDNDRMIQAIRQFREDQEESS